MASGSTNQTVKLWDAQTGQETSTFKEHAKDVWSIATSFLPRSWLTNLRSPDVSPVHVHDRLRQIGRNGLTFFLGANPYDVLTATPGE
jgi:WD40 repeat protein